MKEKKKVLVISVHPDDETLGCGGSILKHLGQGDEVHCVFITGGNIYQRQLIDNINALYGFTSIITLDFKELHLHEMLNELIEALSKIVSIVQAQVLYIPNRSDAHSDHRAVFSAIMACSKNFRYPFIEQILMCEVISETDFAPILGENTFSPNYFIDISLVITYSDTYQGARHTILGDGPKFRKKNTVKDCIHAIKDLAPDLIIVAGWSELIPNEILSIPRMGVIGFHPAKLPFDRGRSVLAWQIEDGYTETSLTMFKYSDYPDGGDILAQETIAIASNDYINDILDKVDAASLNLIRAYFPLLRKGFLKGVKQDLSVGSFRRLRSADDSIIKWDRNSVEIYNKIRAISHPYPGATTKFDDKTMLVWKSEIISSFPFPVDTKPGTIVAQCYDNTLIVKTRDAYLRLTEYEWK